MDCLSAILGVMVERGLECDRKDLSHYFPKIYMMRRTKLGLLIIVGLILISMTVYDLLPYRVRNYVTHSGSTTRSYDLVFNSTTPQIIIHAEPFLDIQDPFPDTINTLIFSSSINASFRISSHNWTAGLYYNFGYVESNTTRFIYNMAYTDEFLFIFSTRNMADISCVWSYTANYTVEMIYSRPPKTYAWATLFSFFSTEGIILVGVVIIASVLIYASIKMATHSS